MMSGYLHFSEREAPEGTPARKIFDSITDAGNRFHHTEQWNDSQGGEGSCVHKIQRTVLEVIADLEATSEQLIEERDDHSRRDTARHNQVMELETATSLQASELARLREYVNACEYLRADEGDSITIVCSNPDFDGPAQAVDASGSWTDWHEKRFTGDSVVAALQTAVAAKQAATKESEGA